MLTYRLQKNDDCHGHTRNQTFCCLNPFHYVSPTPKKRRRVTEDLEAAGYFDMLPPMDAPALPTIDGPEQQTELDFVRLKFRDFLQEVSGCSLQSIHEAFQLELAHHQTPQARGTAAIMSNTRGGQDAPGPIQRTKGLRCVGGSNQSRFKAELIWENKLQPMETGEMYTKIWKLRNTGAQWHPETQVWLNDFPPSPLTESRLSTQKARWFMSGGLHVVESESSWYLLSRTRIWSLTSTGGCAYRPWVSHLVRLCGFK